jgi:hypothetical protein
MIWVTSEAETMRKMCIPVLLTIIFLQGIAVAQESTLRDARVGEWAVYATSDGAMQERHQVIARRKEVVVVKVESIINGRTISSKVENYNVDSPGFLRRSAGEEQITAAGQTYNCVRVIRGQRTLYYNNRIPVTGLVAIYKGDQMVKEIVNFGY